MSNTISSATSNFSYLNFLLPYQSKARDVIIAIATPIFNFLVDCYTKTQAYYFRAQPTTTSEILENTPNLKPFSASPFELRKRGLSESSNDSTPKKGSSNDDADSEIKRLEGPSNMTPEINR